MFQGKLTRPSLGRRWEPYLAVRVSGVVLQLNFMDIQQRAMAPNLTKPRSRDGFYVASLTDLRIVRSYDRVAHCIGGTPSSRLAWLIAL
jgi:hypothetical protein